MRICVVTKIWQSGTAWYASELARGLALHSDKVGFVAPAMEPRRWEPSGENLVRYQTPREDVDQGSRVRSIASKLRRIACNTHRVLTVCSDFDAFIFSIPDPLVTPLVFTYLRIKRKPAILVVHDPLPHDFTSGHGWSQRRRKLVLHALYQSASRLVVLSESGRTVLETDFGIAPNKIWVVPHGAFELAYVSPLPGRQRLLVFGSLRPNKNIEQVIQSVLLMRRRGLDVVLEIAGNPAGGNEAYWARCLALIEQDPAGFELLTRFIEDDEIPAIVSRCDAMVLAYDAFDSQSGVAVMCGLAGRPAITSFAGGIRDLARLGLVASQIEGSITPSAIADATSRLFAEDISSLQARCAGGAARLKAALSWDAVANTLVHNIRTLDRSV